MGGGVPKCKAFTCAFLFGVSCCHDGFRHGSNKPEPCAQGGTGGLDHDPQLLILRPIAPAPCPSRPPIDCALPMLDLGRLGGCARARMQGAHAQRHVCLWCKQTSKSILKTLTLIPPQSFRFFRNKPCAVALCLASSLFFLPSWGGGRLPLGYGEVDPHGKPTGQPHTNVSYRTVLRPRRITRFLRRIKWNVSDSVHGSFQGLKGQTSG